MATKPTVEKGEKERVDECVKVMVRCRPMN